MMEHEGLENGDRVRIIENGEWMDRNNIGLEGVVVRTHYGNPVARFERCVHSEERTGNVLAADELCFVKENFHLIEKVVDEELVIRRGKPVEGLTSLGADKLLETFEILTGKVEKYAQALIDQGAKLEKHRGKINRLFEVGDEMDGLVADRNNKVDGEIKRIDGKIQELHSLLNQISIDDLDKELQARFRELEKNQDHELKMREDLADNIAHLGNLVPENLGGRLENLEKSVDAYAFPGLKGEDLQKLRARIDSFDTTRQVADMNEADVITLNEQFTDFRKATAEELQGLQNSVITARTESAGARNRVKNAEVRIRKLEKDLSELNSSINVVKG